MEFQTYVNTQATSKSRYQVPFNTGTYNNQWVHITLTRASGTSTKIYINGTEASGSFSKGSVTDNPTYLTNCYSEIGGDFVTSGGLINPCDNGTKIDAMSVWQKELTEAEITSLYNTGTGAEYPFSSQLLPSSNDSVSTNHGTLMNGCTFTTGKVGQAFSFDGVNDYVSLPDNSLNLTGDFTISAWVYPTAGTPQAIIETLAYSSGTIYKGWGLDINNVSGGQAYVVTFVIAKGPSGNQYTGWEYRTTALTPNAWNHILIKRVSGVNTYCWINNISQSYVLYGTGKDITLDPTYHTTQYNTIGANKLLSGTVGSYLANGSKIDGLTIWNKALTDDERTQLYNLGTGTQYPFSGQTLPSANNQFAIDNGTLMNGCTFTDGKIGKAFTFDGVNDYVQLPNNSLNFTGDFSFSLWINPTFTDGVDYRIMGTNYYAGGTYGNGWQISRFSSNKVAIQMGSNSSTGQMEGPSTMLPNNTWTHVVVTRKKSTSTKIYINGADVTSSFPYTLGNSSIDPVYATTQYCQIGANKYDANPATGFVSSGTKMDGINVWQKSLTQAEVTELYNSGAGKQLTVATPIVTNGLLLNIDASRLSSYPNAGTTWYDISGNGNNGTLSNGPIFGTANGGVITFDGVNDFVDLGTITSLNLTNITVSAWVNPTLGGGDYTPIICRYSNTTSVNGWELYYVKSSGKFNFGGRESSSAYLSVSSDATYSVNNWYNITGVKSGNSWSLYVNGVLVKTSILGTGNIVFGTNRMVVGADYYNAWEFGKSDISQTMIYNRALSSTEITQNFNATKSRFGL